MFEIQKLDIITQLANLPEKQLIKNKLIDICSSIWFEIEQNHSSEILIVLPRISIDYHLGGVYITEELILHYFPFHNIAEPDYLKAESNTEWREIHTGGEFNVKIKDVEHLRPGGLNCIIHIIFVAIKKLQLSVPNRQKTIKNWVFE